MRIDPTRYIWWLLSRSAGIVALALISFSVLLGLTMATKVLARPGIARKLVRLHEHVALVALAAIAVHGATLLGDRWLKAGVRGLIVPFTMGYRPLYTGLGMIAGYLAALFALSFYVRRRIGTKLWRRLHRATVLVWALAVVHTIGAGSDASTVWLRLMMLAMGAPIVFLFLVRVLAGKKASPARARAAREGSAVGAGAVAAGGGVPAASRLELRPPVAAHPALRRRPAVAGASSELRPPGARDEHAWRVRAPALRAQEPS